MNAIIYQIYLSKYLVWFYEWMSKTAEDGNFSLSKQKTKQRTQEAVNIILTLYIKSIYQNKTKLN